MASYRVIKLFTDLQDNGYKYEVGDRYPHLGYEPDAQRIAELSGSRNKQRTPLIELTPEPDADVSAEETDDTAAEDEDKPKRRRRKAETE